MNGQQAHEVSITNPRGNANQSHSNEMAPHTVRSRRREAGRGKETSTLLVGT